jgi:hypothetical protein
MELLRSSRQYPLRPTAATNRLRVAAEKEPSRPGSDKLTRGARRVAGRPAESNVVELRPSA